MINAAEITTAEYNMVYRAIEREICPAGADMSDVRIARAAQGVLRVLSAHNSSSQASDTVSEKCG